MNKSITGNPIFTRWMIILGGWTIFGLFMTGQTYFQLARAGYPVPWNTGLFHEMVYAYIWAALTPLILHLAQRFPLDSKRWIIPHGLSYCRGLCRRHRS